VSVTKKRVPYVFVLPAAIFFLLFLVAPIIYTVYLSFRKSHVSGLGLGKGSRKEVSAGWSNYANALTSSEFGHGVLRVLGYGAFLVPVMLGLALLFALLLDTPRVKLAKFSRIALFLPYAVPVIVASLLWGFLYLPAVSPLPPILHVFGLQMPDLLSPGSVLFAVANIGIWGGVGYNTIVIYTSLRSIPQEIYEAAKLDGASGWQLALRIKIPMVLPALVLTAVFSIIATLQVFNEPNTIAPMTNSISSTWTPLMMVYRDAFINGDFYSAAAESILIAVGTLILSLGILRLVNKNAFGGEK
jgi:multiple sugar transport system permease protein